MVTVLQFFRNPERMPPNIDENILIAPADGKVVVIEKVIESEIFKDERMLVSISSCRLSMCMSIEIPCPVKSSLVDTILANILLPGIPNLLPKNERTTVVLSACQG
jgi:phosphatidylserine decarboxylase